jgi:DDE superfamily endonuclease
MLPGVTLPGSLAELLWALRPVFTAPSFVTFCGLVAGLAGQVRRRTVCGMLVGAWLGRVWPHDRAHYFFARAAWELDELGVAVARLVVALLVPDGAAVTVAVDDSVFRRAGRKVFGACWQHDASAPARSKTSFGTCFVTVGIVVALPFCTRPVCLPVLARLYLPGQGTPRASGRSGAVVVPGSKVACAAALVTTLAGALPGRALHVVGDAAYHGPALRHLPPGVSWTCRLPKNAVLHAQPPPRRPGTRGRPPSKGPRLGTPAQVAAATSWAPATVRIYGRARDTQTAEATCLWYGSFHTRPVRVILARAPASTLALITTDLATTPTGLIARYAARWSIEQAFADARTVLGAGEARTRIPSAVQRTVPFALIVHTLVITWYARHGHDPADITARRTTQPWYATKTEPAFEDMLTKLRRTLIAARISRGSTASPTPAQTQAVLAAWHAAAA